jgi:hypothetical protein
MRCSLTVASPTDVNHRNPEFSIFVEACEGSDEATFVKQVGHGGTSLFGLPVTADPAIQARTINTLVTLLRQVNVF